MPRIKYLEDGVYASFDGYHVNLAVNDHRNHIISLKPQVMVQLISYFEEIKLLDEKIP